MTHSESSMQSFELFSPPATLQRTLNRTFHSPRPRGNPLNDDREIRIPSHHPMIPCGCQAGIPWSENQAWLPAGGPRCRSRAARLRGYNQRRRRFPPQIKSSMKPAHFPAAKFMTAFKGHPSFRAHMLYWRYLRFGECRRVPIKNTHMSYMFNEMGEIFKYGSRTSSVTD